MGNLHMADMGLTMNNDKLGDNLETTNETYVPSDGEDVRKQVAFHQRSTSIYEGCGSRPKVK